MKDKNGKKATAMELWARNTAVQAEVLGEIVARRLAGTMRSVTAPNVGRDWPELNASLKRRACIAGKEFKPDTVKAARQAAVIEKREEKLAGVLARRAARVAKSFPYPTAKAKKAAGVAERRAARAAMVERKTARAA